MRRWRQTFHLSAAIGIPLSMLQGMIRVEKILMWKGSSVKPVLTEDNKVARFLYCLEVIHPVPKANGRYYYKDMMNRVDVDEKWFKLAKVQNCYIVADANDEEDEE